MNDGSAQRSPLASYRMAKTDDDSEQSEKALMMENTVKVVDTRPEMPSHNSKDDSDRVGKPKDDGVPSGLSNNAKVDMARALLGGGGGEEDFDMSMVPMAFPQRVSTRVLRGHCLFLVSHGTFTTSRHSLIVRLIPPRLLSSSFMTCYQTRRTVMSYRGYLMEKALLFERRRSSPTTCCQNTSRKPNLRLSPGNSTDGALLALLEEQSLELITIRTFSKAIFDALC